MPTLTNKPWRFLLQRILWLAIALAYCCTAAAQALFSVVGFICARLVLPALETATCLWQIQNVRFKGNLKLLLADLRAAEYMPWAFSSVEERAVEEAAKK